MLIAEGNGSALNLTQTGFVPEDYDRKQSVHTNANDADDAPSTHACVLHTNARAMLTLHSETRPDKRRFLAALQAPVCDFCLFFAGANDQRATAAAGQTTPVYVCVS